MDFLSFLCVSPLRWSHVLRPWQPDTLSTSSKLKDHATFTLLLLGVFQFINTDPTAIITTNNDNNSHSAGRREVAAGDLWEMPGRKWKAKPAISPDWRVWKNASLQARDYKAAVISNTQEISVSHVSLRNLQLFFFFFFPRMRRGGSSSTGELVVSVLCYVEGSPHAERPTARLTWPDRRHLILSQGRTETDGANRRSRGRERERERRIRLTIPTQILPVACNLIGDTDACYRASVCCCTLQLNSCSVHTSKCALLFLFLFPRTPEAPKRNLSSDLK